MKKVISVIFIIAIACFATFAQDTQAANNSATKEKAETYSYRNINVLKVLNHPDAFVVIYNKGSIGATQLVIPKSWFKYPSNKAVLRKLPKELNPYMTVTYRNGEFDFVMLNMPQSFSNSAWGILSADYDISSKLDIEALEIHY